MASSSIVSQPFPCLELGHTRQYREELSLAIQECLKILGALIRCLEPFFLKWGTSDPDAFQPVQDSSRFHPPPEIAQATSRFPTKPLTEEIPAFKKATDPGSNKFATRAEPKYSSGHLNFYHHPGAYSHPTPRMTAVNPFPTSCSKGSIHCLVFLATKGGRKLVARSI